MVRFRRNCVPGGTDFFTVTLRDRRSRALTDHSGLLREACRDVRKGHPFQILAIVVLPEHLHTVMTLPEGDADYAGRWKTIKGQFSQSLVKAGVRLAQGKRGEYRFWRRRFWEHTVRDERDLQTQGDYIHRPAKADCLAFRKEKAALRRLCAPLECPSTIWARWAKIPS
jgi:putative transposase